MIYDLFAGPGGWDEGLRRAGHTDVEGFEIDADACNTARANGHRRRRGDVYGLDPRRFAAPVVDVARAVLVAEDR